MIKIQEFGSGSSGNAYLVYDGCAPLLLDCGLSFTALKKDLWNSGYSIGQLTGCLITHDHGDHLKAAGKLAEAGVNIYCSEGTAGRIKTNARHRICYVKAGKPFNFAGWNAMPFDTVHDAVEPLGFILAKSGEKLLYATDTAYIKYRFNGLTHIMVEANYSKDLLHQSDIHEKVRARIVQNHFSIENVLEMLKANDLSKVQEIWLLHLSENHADPREFKRLVQEQTGIPTKIAERRRIVDGNYSPEINIKKTTGQVKRRWG